MAPVIDSDQHLYETRTTWLDHIDPAHRDDALRIVDDELGYPWLSWGADRKLGPVDVQHARADERARRSPRAHPRRAAARVELRRRRSRATTGTRRRAPTASPTMGVDEAVVFPNFGLLWERTLDDDLGSLTANMTAWNRWCASVVDRRSRARAPGRAPDAARRSAGSTRELARSRARRRAPRDDRARARRRPAALASRPRPDLARVRRARRHAGVPRRRPAPRVRRRLVLGARRRMALPPLESIFLWTAAALACTDLILNGTLERFPELRIGIVELSAVWVPMFLMMLDGGTQLHDQAQRPAGVPVARCSRASTSAVRCACRRSRTSCRAGSSARPATSTCAAPTIRTPRARPRRSPTTSGSASRCAPEDAPGLFGENVSMLLTPA